MIAQTASHQSSFAQQAVRPLGAPTSRALEGLDDLARAGVRMTFSRDEEIFGESEPAEYAYRVLSGAVRCYRLLSDGRRQICDFHLEGGFFGVEVGLDHRVTAEALCDGTVVLVIRRAALSELAAHESRIAGALWRLSAEGLQRSQDHILMLGRKNAVERLAGFLLDFANRLGAPGEFDLPMSRQDIADYLGLTIETVSRTFSQLEATGVLKAHNSRHIRLADRPALEEFCE